MPRAALPQRTQTPQKSLTCECCARPERERADDIDPAAHATIHHDGRPTCCGRYERRQSIDGCRQRIDLPAPMVRHDDAVHSERYRALGVRRVQHTFDDERPLPALAIAANFLPSE